MPKTIIALALAFVAVAAQAQNTAEAIQFRIDQCALTGRVAANSYRYKAAGKEYPMNMVPDTAMRSMDLWAINYGRQAPDSGEASRGAIAKCLDNIDRIYRDSRHGHRTTVDELQ